MPVLELLSKSYTAQKFCFLFSKKEIGLSMTALNATHELN